MLEDARPALARLVIERLRLAGVRLAVDGDAVVFYPPHSIPDDLLDELRRYKPEIIASLTAEAETLAMPLDVFEARGAMAEIRVPWLPMTLWFVPSEREAAGLTGISRGRIWTARELIDLMSLDHRKRATVQTIARAKLEFGGDIIEVRVRNDASDGLAPQDGSP